MVHLLLKNGAAIDLQNEEGFAALHIAAQRGRTDIVMFLPGTGRYGKPPKQLQAVPSIYSGPKWFCKNRQDAVGGCAARETQLTDPTRSPLHFAANHNHSDIVTLLLDAGTDVNWFQPSDHATALHAAAQNGHAGVAKKLIAAGAQPDSAMQGGWRPLHLAALNLHNEITDLLLASQAEVNVTQAEGYTPLHLAILARDKLAGSQRISKWWWTKRG